MKIKTNFLKSFKLPFCRKGLTIFLLGLFFYTPLFSQLPTAQDIGSQMKVGWNMGNTLEAICGETVWGGAYTTQELIDSVKAAGFNTVRLPCAWFCHSDTTTNVINSTWLERVEEVVNYCIIDSLYVIINIHWDSGWLENRVTETDQQRVNKRQKAYWTQIADYFKDYDEHLLFAGANEPNVEDAEGMSVLLSYHQTFIDAVRATGGNNSTRTLIIQGPSTDIDKTNNLMNTFPTDQIQDRLMVEIHYYTPYQFTLMSSDASWGKMFYYWGKGYHSTTDVTRNATWGEESDVEKYFGLMKTKFIDEGIPVIMGEYHAMKRKNLTGDNLALHSASVEYWHKYVTASAVRHGLIPVYWDINMGLFDRSKGSVLDHGVLDAIMQGAEMGSSTDVSDKTNSEIPYGFRLEQNYPNPFNPITTIRYSIPIVETTRRVVSTTLKIYDILGNVVATLVNEEKTPGNYEVTFDASHGEQGRSMTSGVYFYRLDAGTFHDTKKLLLLK